MATYTAVIGDATSVGLSTFTNPNSIQMGNVGGSRRNPQLATARIRTIQDPHIVQDAVGGMISADFTIPFEEALRWRAVLKYGVVCWLFDGATPIFVGWAEQPIWTQTGDCQMMLSGPWVLLGRSRMREIWEDYDLSQFNPFDPACGHVNTNGQVAVTSANRLKISYPSGTSLSASDRAGVDYFAFGEAIAASDDKLLTAFEFDISDNAFSSNVNLAFRVIGVASPNASTGDQLYSTTAAGSSGIQGACNLNGTNQSGAWLSTFGYRCLKFELLATSATNVGGAGYVVLDRIRVSTRESLFPAITGNIDTGVLARDVLTFNLGGGGVSPESYVTSLPQEFWYSGGSGPSPDTNTFKYVGGLDPRIATGTAQNTGIASTGFNAVAWQSPAEILTSLAATDGAHVGFYLPYNQRGGYDAPGAATTPTPFRLIDVGSWWLTAPPQLTYQLFTDPTTTPDYTIHTREGAQVEQDPNAQPLINQEYVNYQTTSGRQQSVIATDQTTLNYSAAQGYRRSEDYTLQGSSGSKFASSQGSQTLVQRRQPIASATITIQNDGSARYPILKQGAVIPHLAQVRPGSVRIVDVAAASGLRSGYATHVEWWGQTLTSNERIEIQMGQPGQVDAKRLQGMIVNRYKRTRRGPFSRGSGF